jgi:radical SAM protein with 4Fe4S-binding SPASM domain
MIKVLELDPNGLCNAKCWYCPVAYGGNPVIGRKNMPIEMFINVLDQLDKGRGDFVDPNFSIVINAHYNEILLYPYFEEMIQAYRKYGLKTILFSNGTTLTKEKIDFIKQYPDVVYHITLNIPSAFPEQWSQYTGFNVKMFDKLIENLKYAELELSKNDMYFGIQVNGIQEESFFENGGAIRLLNKAPHLNYNKDNGDVAKTIEEFKDMFPLSSVFSDVHLNDRSGKLEENDILSNQDIIKIQAENFNKKVTSCAGGEVFAQSRSEEWLHINANGDVILCCHDYDFKTSYINIKDKSIKDIWNGPERREMIDKSYNSFCRSCKYAVWS